MIAAITAEAIGRLKASPPWSKGLSRKSPKVAPSGRVRMKAPQNSSKRDTCPIIECRGDRQSGAEHKRSTLISETACVGDPVAKSGAQCLGKCNGRPVEGFDLGRADRFD